MISFRNVLDTLVLPLDKPTFIIPTAKAPFPIEIYIPVVSYTVNCVFNICNFFRNDKSAELVLFSPPF